jgi:hypothetical protein
MYTPELHHEIDEIIFNEQRDFMHTLKKWQAVEMHREIERLQQFEKQMKDIQELINEKEPLKFVDAEIKSGTFIDAIIHGALARVVCESLVRLFIESGSENYLEIEMQKSQKDAAPEWYTLLIQKKTGMTPAQKNVLLQSQVKELIEAGNWLSAHDGCSSAHQEWRDLVSKIQKEASNG